jgi:vacuolar-type H+-ATPase subunit D/Vma8
MKKLLSYFVGVSFLQRKSEGLLSVFTTLTKEMVKVNQKIDEKSSEILNQIAEQQKDLNQLSELKQKNTKILTKIENLLND